MPSALLTNAAVLNALGLMGRPAGSIDNDSVETYIAAADAYIQESLGPHPVVDAGTDSADVQADKNRGLALRRRDLIACASAALSGKSYPVLTAPAVDGYGALHLGGDADVAHS